MISFTLDDVTHYINETYVSSVVVRSYSVEIFVDGEKYVSFDLTLNSHKNAWEQIKDKILD